MNPTAKDPHNIKTLTALAWLECAHDSRVRYNKALRQAIHTHGDRLPGESLISGVYRDAFPEGTKGVLRFYAHIIGEQVGHAFECWHAAGRLSHTLRPYVENARILSDDYVSYY